MQLKLTTHYLIIRYFLLIGKFNIAYCTADFLIDAIDYCSLKYVGLFHFKMLYVPVIY